MLADLLDDNAALHRVYAMLAPAQSWPIGLGRAAAHVAALRSATGDASTTAACERMLEALAGLRERPDDSRGALEQALGRSHAAIAHPATSLRERKALLLRQELLRHRLRGVTQPETPGIPRIVHLVKTDSGGADLPLLQYLCYRSVIAHCPGYRILLHAPEVPRGARWERLLPHFEVQVESPPQWLGTRRIVAAAHQSDVWRVKQLIRHGGFYFDWDLLLLRSPEGLRGEVCVMALERKEAGYDEVLGVSAIGAEPGSRYLSAWLEAMASVFNPRRYVAHSTVLARRLALEQPALVRVLDYRAFYDPGWSEEGMRWLFDPRECLPEGELRERLSASTGMHLFCSHANFLHWAAGLTEKDIEAPRCNLALLLRPYL